jgi:hypothetical protein
MHIRCTHKILRILIAPKYHLLQHIVKLKSSQSIVVIATGNTKDRTSSQSRNFTMPGKWLTQSGSDI